MMSQSTNQDEGDRQFLSDLERATALSLESKALEDIKRHHTVPPNTSIQDYQNFLKQREQLYNDTRRKSSSQIETRTTGKPLPSLTIFNSKSVDQPDETDQPDLISFNSPTSVSATTSTINHNNNSTQAQFELFEQIQKLNLQSTTSTNYKSPAEMQIVPYQHQQPPQNIPLTPAYLTQLYNMNSQPMYVLPGFKPVPAPTLPTSYQTYQNINSVNNFANGIFSHNYANFPTSYSNTFHPKVEPEPLPAPPKTSTPKAAIPSTYSQVQLRKPPQTNLNDNLIDLGNDDQDLHDSRVSVLEAFDPLICRANEADETSSEYYSEYDPYDCLYSEKSEYFDPVYEAVNKSDKLPPPAIDWKYDDDSGLVPPPLPPRNSIENAFNYEISDNSVKRQKLATKLYQSIVTQKLYDPELISFYQMVLKVRQRYKFNDLSTNPGYVIASELPNYYSNSTSIKLVVYPSSKCFIRPVSSNGEKRPIEGYETPIVFTCDISTTVDHVLEQCMCTLEGQIKGSRDDFMLKPIGVLEWLRPTSKLSQLETVHNSIKLEKDVQFGLCPRSMVTIMSIGRTQKDDIRDNEIKIEEVLPNEVQSTINYDSLMIILETIEAEIDRLESSSWDGNLSCSGVTQAVKAVCSLLGSIETLEISDAVQNLKNICLNSDMAYGSKMEVVSENGDYAEVALRSRTLPEQIVVCCNKIREAVKLLLNMYSQVFRVNFVVNVNDINLTSKSLASVTQPIRIHLTCLYRLPPYWKFDDYRLGTQIYHGTRYIGDAKVAQCLIENSGAYPRLKFKSWLNFENIPVCILPRESRVVFVLYGCMNEPNDSNSNEVRDGQNVQTKTELGWFSIQFFDFDAVLIQGSYLLPLWPPTTDKYLGPAPGKGTHPNCNDYPVLGIEVPDFGGQIKFPETPTTSTAPRLDFNSLDVNLQQELIDTAQQGYQNAADQREVLWEKRYYLQTFPHALPKVLHAAHSWDFASLVDLHALIRSWHPLSPIQALELLLPRYPDLRVRTCAVEWFSAICTDQLVDYLPQLVQALKHDTYEASALSFFLLSRSLESPRVAHYLYWLLVQNLPGDSPQNSSMELSQTNIDEMLIAQSRYHRRNQLLLRALLATCGEKLSSRFLTQNIMCKNLADIAQSVKLTKETHRQKILFQKLEIINQQLTECPTSLPLGPAQEVYGVNSRTSSYFNSNTLPLKINFVGTDKEIIPAIFKCGDDLQQDMLTLQLVRIMDKLWLREGLDLKIVTFNCIPTGFKKGIIELVSEAETLRKIQVEWGLTGSFKDKPIAEWLARQNPSNLEYHRAVDNFTVSCAGYSVATYVLGICDRHNDNIMLKTSGHLFHIDFGKFLGDAQMFGNFKRDRTPFVLTSDMAYVINGGEKPSTKFHRFVDICCQAFNIVRQHGDFLLHMLALMATSGIPGVTADSVNYVRKALLPGQSNPEAAASFAKMIHISLKSWFTQVNFFLHNIAQMRFSNEEGSDELLSFVPRTYTLIQDGRLKSVTVHGYQKRYELEKYYTYILKVTRQNQPDPSYLFRSYKEFLEFHQKLCLHFPLAKLHSLQSGLHVGRSHIKTVAERRLPEIQQFLVSLFQSADEIAHSDLVYTFFHPLWRDQQEANINVKKVKELKNVPSQEQNCGQIKFSLQYLRGALTVMIHHARSLPLTANGQEPNTYVKCYLKPDPSKQTKRKTKVVKKSCCPSFMETLEYRMPLEVVQGRTLEVTIWSHDSLQENEFLGGIQYELDHRNLCVEINEWFGLCYLPRS